MTAPRVSVIGGGAWGTALAQTACRAGADTLLWARKEEVADAINTGHENPTFLPGLALDPRLVATADLAAAAAHANIAIVVVPAQHLREIAERLRPLFTRSIPIVIAAKGIEIGSAATVDEIVQQSLPDHRPAILSGPTFAAEVAAGLPTAVTLACRSATDAARIIKAIGTPSFRPYRSDDLVGSALGGAVKNVLAIACGIVAGRHMGDNARAALITRGLAEMIRLVTIKGGEAATCMGLSGLGDLVLTCTAMQSRNCSLGVALGQGKSLDAMMRDRRSVAEGVTTSIAVCQLAERLGVEMPISQAVRTILHDGSGIDETIKKLLGRPFKSEFVPC